MIAWYIVHRDRRRRREDRAETPDVFLVSAADVVGVKKKIKVGRGREGLERSGSGSSSQERINTHALHSLHDMHVGEAAVHHISEEDDCVRTLALRDAPRLAQIHVDEDPGDGPEERAALRVRPVIENLRIGDEEDVSCLSTSLDDRVGRSVGQRQAPRRGEGERQHTPGSGQRQRAPAARNMPISSHRTIAVQIILMALSEYLGTHIIGSKMSNADSAQLTTSAA